MQRNAFDFGKALVVFDNFVRVHSLLVDAAADDIQAVESRLFANAIFVTSIRKRSLGDRKIEVLRHFVLANNFANSKADFFLAAKWICFTLRGDSNRFELLSVASSNSFRLRARCSASRRIATDNQSLVGKMFRCHLGQILCVEQRHLDRAGCAQLANSLGTQGGNPVQTIDTSQVFVDPSRRDHAAITNENEPVDAETFTSRRDDLSECRRVGRVAREDFNRNRTTFRITQQTVHDLRAIATMIATVTMFNQRTLSSRVIARRNIEQYQLPVLQVLLGELVFDPRLTCRQPIHRGIQLMDIDVANRQLFSQRVLGSLGRHAPSWYLA
ncbi:MAG: hypothetical protein R3C28_17320 [Pirellulaceae bacterium]